MGFFSAHEVSPADIADDYGDLLIPGEEVLTGFKVIRDIAFLTSLRVVVVEVAGLTGSRKTFTSIPYRSITKFAIETAGHFDMDSDLQIWVTGQPDPIVLKVSRSADPRAIVRTLSEQVTMKR